jgi:hypothetical protein
VQVFVLIARLMIDSKSVGAKRRILKKRELVRTKNTVFEFLIYTVLAQNDTVVAKNDTFLHFY